MLFRSLIKKILCGYICIIYTEGEKFLKINKRASFIVLPEVLFNFELMLKNNEMSKKDGEKKKDLSWYYRYITKNTDTHQIIKFNTMTNKIITGDDLNIVLQSYNINKNYDCNRETTIIDNPLSILEI